MVDRVADAGEANMTCLSLQWQGGAHPRQLPGRKSKLHSLRNAKTNRERKKGWLTEHGAGVTWSRSGYELFCRRPVYPISSVNTAVTLALPKLRVAGTGGNRGRQTGVRHCRRLLELGRHVGPDVKEVDMYHEKRYM